ncbi:alpha-L-fucosidase [Arenibacter sp. ARW7G5Y1]|uniref:alpha-L-fucosidase n=1 Tax=Arenibacter sp. ARW7G5Y1 TaxID=2135619 RepID=UPI000D76ABFC|nr:alpha-L-fucosidase [Arenibacter sp. ARW7G5Y1]PXX23994.1 alpha-L-fucosidase-like protein [Arenibacter sp. ARW7G5Y1]
MNSNVLNDDLNKRKQNMINKTSRILMGIMLISFPLFINAQQKLKRADSFFGFHFDFHATANDKDLGKYFNEKDLADFLRRTKPDYVQIDSKGHPGFSSYPTKVGYSANSFNQDPMRLWREVTNSFNIPLYVHYSGIWDDKGISSNPEWARVNADGSKDLRHAAYLGPYSDKLLIPQIKEMIDNYKIDGAWIDGDCWATGPDYSPEVVDAFLQVTGLDAVPLNSEDPNYGKWLDFNRTKFKQYLEHYVDAIHTYKPGFQVASNWAYSSMMPEKVNINVDFLSGDVSGQNCVYSAAFQARCLALQGKPWDLMSWGFVPLDFSAGIHSPKSLVQLQQEAAQVMAMGGGFQVYFQQNRDASFQNSIDVDAMTKLAEFCRERQPFCQNSNVIPQIALWYSGEGWKKDNKGVYGWGSNMEGLNNLFMDGQNSVEILMDHHLDERMEKYPVIVIPEWDHYDRILKKRLLEYVHNGGNLFVMGANAVNQFEPYLGVTFVETNSHEQFNIGDKDLNGITGIRTNWQKVTPKEGTSTIGHVYHQRDYRFATEFPVATIADYGKGKIAGLYMDLSESYNVSRHPIYNKIVNNVLDKLNPTPGVRVIGSEKIHVVLGKNESNILVHLINADGAHFNKNVYGYSEVMPSNSLTIEIKSNNKPKAINLQPDGKRLKFDYQKNLITVNVPPVDIYSIIEVEY